VGLSLWKNEEERVSKNLLFRAQFLLHVLFCPLLFFLSFFFEDTS
jgi:preprotein translocase subunit SecG